MSLPAGCELEDEDAAVGGRVEVVGALLFDQRKELAVGWKHDEIHVWLGCWCRAWAPAEVEQVVFGVEVDVAWCWVWLDFAALKIAAAGFEGDERSCRHVVWCGDGS